MHGSLSRAVQDYLPPPTKRVYVCAVCSASGTECQLTSCHQIISKSFQGRNGQAYAPSRSPVPLFSLTRSLELCSYLFNSVINVSTGPEEEREMLTGVHVVRDIYCISCQSNVGWKYVRPHTLPRLPPSLARFAQAPQKILMFVRALCSPRR